MHQFLNTDTVKVTKLLLSETGTYNTQWRRPYATHTDGNVMNTLQERVSGTGTVAASQIAGVAFQFLSPTLAPEERPVSIINGWDQRRLRFMMEAEVTNQMGVTVTQVLMGYTDYPGIAMSMEIDPKMTFFINSTVSIKSNTVNNGFGNQLFTIAGEASHVLADNGWSGIYTDEKDYRMRPTDVFGVMTRTHVNPITAGNYVDSRNMMTSAPLKSRRTNSLAASFAANILSTYSSTVSGDDFLQSEDAILANARGHCMETPVGQDKFMNALAQMRGAPATNYFSFGELTRLSPSVTSDEVTVVVVNGQAERAQQHVAGQTEGWHGAVIETQYASILSQSVPALMMELGLLGISFSITNKTLNGMMENSLMDVKAFNQNMDARAMVTRFFTNLEINVMRDVSQNNQLGYQIRMNVDLVGDTTIGIQIEGNPWITYNVPSFSDALMAPVVTASDAMATNMAKDFQKIFQDVIGGSPTVAPSSIVQQSAGNFYGMI
jgi:hypothetical protein